MAPRRPVPKWRSQIVALALLVLSSGLVFADARKEIDSLKSAMKKAAQEKRSADVSDLCDRILARDIVEDFIELGGDPVDSVLWQLRPLGEMNSRISQWESELANDPKSERLNILMAISSGYVRGVKSDVTKAPNISPPLRLRLEKNGDRLTGSYRDSSGAWKELRGGTILLPEKFLIGFCANKTSMIFSEVSLLVDGSPVPFNPTEKLCLGRKPIKGGFKATPDSVEIQGEGHSLYFSEADEIFFACEEIAGENVVFEATVNSAPPGEYDTPGLMIRASSAPESVYSAVTIAREGVNMWRRTASSKASTYFDTLLSLRPNDRRFTAAVLQEMISRHFYAASLEGAREMLAKDPSYAEFTSVIEEIIAKNDVDSVKELLAVNPPKNDEERSVLASKIGARAEQYQWDGDQERAVESWYEMRDLLPDYDLPLESQIGLLASLRVLKREAEMDAVLRDFFLRPKPGAPGWLSRAPNSRSTDIVGLSEAGFTDIISLNNMLPVFPTAAERGLASEIAGRLEAQIGSERDELDAKAVAVALKIAAKDPSLAALAKAGDAFAQSLDPNLQSGALLLIATQLQTSAEFRPAVPGVLDKWLASSIKGDSRRALVLLWQSEIFSLLGDSAGSKAALDKLCSEVESRGTNFPSVMGAALLHTTSNGSLDSARKLSKEAWKDLECKDDPCNQISELIAFLSLLDGKGKIMPNVWCDARAGGETEVHWEFGPDNWELSPEREIRSRGIRIPPADGKYDLEIYAFDGKPYGRLPSDFPEANRVAVIRGIDSIGSWTGKLPAGGKWISGVLRDKEGAFLPSPPVPVVSGENLLPELSPQTLASEPSPWKSSTSWYWKTAKPSSPSRESLYVSRFRSGKGQPFFTSAPIPIDPTETYVFKAWVKGRHSRNDLPSYYYAGDADFQVTFLNAAGNEVGSWIELPNIGNMWVLISQQFSPRQGVSGAIPPNAASAVVRVRYRNACEVAEVGFYRIPHAEVAEARH